MSIQVECDCGKVLRVKDDAGGKRVKCPDCHAMVKIPLPDESPDFEVVEDDEPKPKLRKGNKPVKAVVAEIDEDEDQDEPREKKKPAKKKRKRRAAGSDDDDDGTSAFWKTPTGMILNGLGLMGLGVAGIAFYFFTDDRETGVIIAGALCICFGIGGVITGLTMKPKRGERRRDDDDDDDDDDDEE